MEKAIVSSLVLAGAVSTALARVAAAAPLTKAEADATIAAHKEKEKMLWRGSEGSERLRRWSRHHLLGHLDHRLPGQCLEVRAGGICTSIKLPNGKTGSLKPV